MFLKKIPADSVNRANEIQMESKLLRDLRHKHVVQYVDDFLHLEEGRLRARGRGARRGLGRGGGAREAPAAEGGAAPRAPGEAACTKNYQNALKCTKKFQNALKCTKK